jgi:hypothetical protein
MLIMLCPFVFSAQCLYGEYRYAKYHCNECQYVECHHAEGYYAGC